jgi:Ca2+-binding RTX toxin-like protein
MLRHVLLTLVFIALLAAPAARGATVSLSTSSYGDYKYGTSLDATVTVTAGPGERNDMRIAWPGDGPPASLSADVTVTDAGAPLQAGPNCRALTPNAVACAVPRAPNGSFVAADVALGDGDDRLTADGLGSLSAKGGDGADRLDATGARGNAIFNGGPGDDALLGGLGNDTLTGGPGADLLLGGTGGHDRVSYADHTAGVTVRIGGMAAGGAPGEGDVIGADVEDAQGGAGDDLLIGTDAADTLDGGGGKDRLEGLGGDDHLSGGGGGADTVLGADGDDDLTADGPGGLLDGGAGNDVLSPRGAVVVRPGPGDDAVLGALGRFSVDAAGDDGRDRVSCHDGEPAFRVTLGDGDFSDNCGPHVRQRHPVALALSGERTALGPGVAGLPAAAFLTCGDVARRGCAVRVSLRVAASGRVLKATRRTLRPGAQWPLTRLAPRPADADRLTARTGRAAVAYVASVRAPDGTVQTLRLRGQLLRGVYTALPTAA